MLYFADRISEHIRKREPEGYLICTSVPIARSGTQQYMKDEIGQQGESLVTVYRPEEEVFSKATMASFEGMPVTNDHPDSEDGVTAENIQWLQKGHCQNVRRGTGSEKNMLLADLVITDPDTIQQVLDGKREISCGYNYDLCEEDGQFIQRAIRGNHIAIVDKGRAGKRVCIKDSAPTPNKERRKNKMAKNHTGILAKMLAHFAKDAEPEELEEAVDAIEDITTATGDEDVPAETTEQPVVTDEDGRIEDIIARLEKLEAALAAKDEDPEEDPLKQLEEDLDEAEAAEEPVEEEEGYAPDEDPDEPEAHFVDPEELNEEDEEPEVIEEEEEITADKKACDAARTALKAIKPVIASLPPSQRKAAADKAVAAIRKASGLSAKPASNGYTKIMKRSRKASDSRADDLAQRIMASRNVNYKK